MKKRIIFFAVTAAVLALLNSCNAYLDTLPDNRTELDSEEKIRKLLISAYGDRLPLFLAEMASDNYDFRGPEFNNTTRMQEEYFYWEDPMETGNEGIKNIWGRNYYAIAHSNLALEAIEKAGSPKSMDALRGEALITRAYHHFVLANVFCHHYDSRYADTDLGIPYSESPETSVNPQYSRGTLAETYRKIEQDLLEALPLIDDNLYDVPKYHFNRRAAYAFATRFYLYYKKYDKAIEYADLVLGNDPESVLRDMTEFTTMTQEYAPMAEHYIKPIHTANLLLMPIFCDMVRLTNYSTGKRYQTTDLIATTETIRSSGPWGDYGSNMFYLRPLSYSSNGYNLQAKFPYMFEVTDPIANTGYRKTVMVAFHTDEVLLARAEANIMKSNPDYNAAVKDLALWMSRHTTSGTTLTYDLIQDYYGNMEYWDMDSKVWTPKKKLNPEVPFVNQEQENMMHCLLHFRRIETTGEGLRWFDVKRYNIEIHRRLNPGSGDIESLDKLSVRDNRHAVQLPQEVYLSGIEKNPR